MNSTLCALLERVLILACTLGILCQCSSPLNSVPNPEPEVGAWRFNKEKLARNVKKLKRGDSMQRCVSLLGEPNRRRELWPKTYKAMEGTVFSYIVYREGTVSNLATDRCLDVYFDPAGHLEFAVWYDRSARGEYWIPPASMPSGGCGVQFLPRLPE
jgi:hypothetical protein